MASDIKQVIPLSDKEGYLYLHQEEKKSLKKFFCVGSGVIPDLAVGSKRKYIHIWKQSAGEGKGGRFEHTGNAFVFLKISCGRELSSEL